MIQGALKLIKCVTVEPSGYICNRWLADFPINTVMDMHTCCPTCHQHWHISQDENDIIRFQKIKKSGKVYEDDGLRIIVKEESETANAT